MMASRGNYHQNWHGPAAAARRRRSGLMVPQYHGGSSPAVPPRNPRNYGISQTYRGRTAYDSRDPNNSGNYGPRGLFATDFATYEDDVIVEEIEDADWEEYSDELPPPDSRKLSQSISYDSDLSGSPSNSGAKRTVDDWHLLFDTGIVQPASEFSVSAILPKGRKVSLQCVEGMRVRDLMAAAMLEYKLPDCRVRLASTRALLNEDAEAFLLRNKEIEFEERLLEIPVEGTSDRCLALLLNFIISQRDYCDLLRSYFNTYEEPLSQLPSLSSAHKRLLFSNLRPLQRYSTRLLAQLEELVTSWNTRHKPIGAIFAKELWLEHRNYYTTYNKIRGLTHYLRQHNQEFIDLCQELRGAARHSFDSLILLPVQRVSQYDKVLHNLLENSSSSGSRHPRDYESLLDPERTVRELVKEREEEMSQAENESRLLQIQERFPHDELNLFGAKEMTRQQKFKALSTRRRSAPTTVIRSALSSSSKIKTIQDKSNNNNSPPGSMLALDLGPLSSSLNLSSMRDTAPSPTSDAPSCKRLYIMEGPVQISVGLQNQSRYLVLLNDTLLIAKQKSSTSFRLKHRLRVGELWLNTCIDEVSEVIKSHDFSFVLGWPTNNVVLTFASNQERELWWQSLSKHIETMRKEDDGKAVHVRVLNRDPEYSAFPSKTLQIGSHQRSSDLIDMAMREFGMPEEARTDYQLWVQSGREDSLYPLIGHEYPYAIKMSHLRDAQDKPSDAVFTSEMEHHLSSADNELREHQCQFIVRRKGKTGSGMSIDTSAIQRRLKKGRKSPFKLSFKRSISNKELTSPGSSPLSPHARLFGLPLSMVCPDNTLPKPVLDLLHTLYHQAPFVTGIFRKSANARVCRELKEALDAGEQCNIDDVSVHVAASVLKEFLRSLPDSLLVCSQCEEWISATEIEDKEEKLNTIKGLLDQLLDINMVLMRYLFNVLHYVSLHMEENNMTSYNLAICVAPSLLWPPANASPITQAMATKKIPTVVEFMIDNAKSVFGDDVLTLFGDAPVHRTEHRRHDSSGDSDSMNEVSPFIKRDDSSLDSIEKEFFANDIEQDAVGPSHKWHYGNTPVLSPSTLSRDSGITSSDNQLYPDSDNTDTTDSGMDSKEKLTAVSSAGARPAKTPSQFSSTDDLFWRQRRGSEPSPLSKEGARNRMALLSADSTADNSPELSDHEHNLSEDTLKLIKDLNRECSSKLLNSMLPEDMRSNSRRSSANDSSLQLSEKGLRDASGQGVSSMPTTPTDEEPPAGIPYARRQSVPSIGSGSPTFPRRLTSSRRSASSMSSSSSERMSDVQSSSSSERLHTSMLGMKPHRTDIDMAKTLQVASSNPGRLSPRSSPNIGQHGFQPSYKKMFINSNTGGLPSRPAGAPVRPRNLNVPQRPSHHKEATPPREFFPKDATTRSTLSQSPRGLATHQEHTEKRMPSPIKRNSSPTISITQHNSKQRVSKTLSDTSSQSSSSSSSQSRSTPPSYQEAMTRRAVLQRNTKSLDTDSIPTTNEQTSRRRSNDSNAPKHRHEERVGKAKRHVAGGIIFLGSDTDTSDEDDEYRAGYPNGPTKNRGVRRTSSDSVATNRKGLTATSVQRSSSDTAKPMGNEVRTKHQQSNVESTRRSSQPAPRRRHHNGEGPRRPSTGSNPSRRQAESAAPSNSEPSRTELHFPFPDPRAEPPASPLSSPRSKPSPSDSKNGFKKASTAEVVSQARRDWQRKKASSGKDLRVADLSNIDYTDESYV